MKTELKNDFENVVELMGEVIADRTVPRNIRSAVEEAKNKIKEESGEEEALKFSAAIYVLDDISSDINMPTHTRTEIWEIISQLEAIKEKLK